MDELKLEESRERVRQCIKEQIDKFELPEFVHYDVPSSHPLHGYFPASFKMPIQLPETPQMRDPAEMLSDSLACFQTFAYYKKKCPDFQLRSTRSRPLKRKRV